MPEYENAIRIEDSIDELQELGLLERFTDHAGNECFRLKMPGEAIKTFRREKDGIRRVS